MTGGRRKRGARADRDGVRITAPARVRNGVRLLAGAIVLAALGLLAAALWLPGPGRRAAPAAPEPERVAAAAAGEVRPAPVRLGARPRAAAPARAAPAEPEPPRAPAEAGAAPRAPSGIALFPPPGTDPVKIGIVVPDDYVLPEGYVRHYQVTDDGRDLLPILMFHPDYEWVGPDGEPIEIPADHIVPPALAPPDLPIRMLEPPEAEGEPVP